MSRRIVWLFESDRKYCDSSGRFYFKGEEEKKYQETGFPGSGDRGNEVFSIYFVKPGLSEHSFYFLESTDYPSRGSTMSFSEGPERKYFRFCWPRAKSRI